jgi:hypothetical protein
MPLLYGKPNSGPFAISNLTEAVTDYCSSALSVSHQAQNSSVYSISQVIAFKE